MTKEEIIEIARQAGFKVTQEGKLIIYGEGYLKPHYEGKIVDGIKAVIDIATAREREACAEIAEKQRYAMYISLTSHPIQNGTAVKIANQIRARGQE
jgi:hypothetical protein